MHLDEAVCILEALADGRDPDTDAPLPRESIFHNPQVIRALYTAIQELTRSTGTEAEAGGALDNAGKPWGAKEKAELVREFEAGMTLTEMAKRHGRTVAAIHGRLYLFGQNARLASPGQAGLRHGQMSRGVI